MTQAQFQYYSIAFLISQGVNSLLGIICGIWARSTNFIYFCTACFVGFAILVGGVNLLLTRNSRPKQGTRKHTERRQ